MIIRVVCKLQPKKYKTVEFFHCFISHFPSSFFMRVRTQMKKIGNTLDLEVETKTLSLKKYIKNYIQDTAN